MAIDWLRASVSSAYHSRPYMDVVPMGAEKESYEIEEN